VITAGQRGDSPQFQAVLEAISVPRTGPGRAGARPDRVLADKAYGSRANRACLRRRGIAATIPEPADPPPQEPLQQRRPAARARPRMAPPELMKHALAADTVCGIGSGHGSPEKG